MKEQEAYLFLNRMMEGMKSKESCHDPSEFRQFLSEHGVNEENLMAAYLKTVARGDGDYTYSRPQLSGLHK